MNLKKNVAMLAAVMCAVSIRSSAQSSSDLAAWEALVVTPIGAFAPQPFGSGTSLAVRYGRMSKGGATTSNFGAGVRLGPLGINAGITKPDCLSGETCGVYMAAVDLNLPIISTAMGSGTLKIGLDPAAGYAKPRDSNIDANFMSAAVSLPFELSFPLGSSATLTPYLVPGFGYGRVSGSASTESVSSTESGTRTMFGGGLAIGTSMFQISAGFQKVFLTDAPTVIGVNLSIGGGHK